MYRVILYCLILLAAIACYLLSSVTGFAVLLVLGVGLEAVFWLALMSRRRRGAQSNA